MAESSKPNAATSKFENIAPVPPVIISTSTSTLIFTPRRESFIAASNLHISSVQLKIVSDVIDVQQNAIKKSDSC